MTNFNYREAFSRNIGVVSEETQDKIQSTTVAIAGCGGMGGAHAHTLARLGVGQFKLADPDIFELANFNRQYGATTETVDCFKTVITELMIREINPEASVHIFPSGITTRNIDNFLKGVDVVVDALDFFALGARKLLFDAAFAKGIPVITAAPVGLYGFAKLFWSGESFNITFSTYDEIPIADQLTRFAEAVIGPNIHQYFLPGALDIGSGLAPSTIIGVQDASAKAARLVLEVIQNAKAARLVLEVM